MHVAKQGVLRPEAIESVFILYRITGDPVLQEKAWTMFNSIIKHTITDIAHAGLHSPKSAQARPDGVVLDS